MDDYSSEDPGILQLHKWKHFPDHVDLSEFREAFISPTRDLILLHSYNSEALLLPLISGNSENSNSLVSGSPELIDPTTRLGSSDSSPSISGSDSYNYICDVNSLAWGACETIYDHNKDSAAFREILFVSGNHGLTLHAFREPDDRTKEMTTPSQEKGGWIHWGPSVNLVDKVDVGVQSSLCGDASEGVLDGDRINLIRESVHSFSGKNGKSELSGDSASKRWLRTFYTKVERLESDSNGNLWTKFPEKYSFPCSADIVSFSIFDSNSLLPDLRSTATLTDNTKKGTSLDPMIDAPSGSATSSCSLHDILSNLLDFGMSNFYKCSRVFSSNSHSLIGFFLTLVDPVTINSRDSSGRSLSRSLLLAARLHRSGIQWLSSVKLEENHNMKAVVEWIDFQFSEELIVCLRASGSVFFYGATTGEYISHLNILQVYELNVPSNLQEWEQMSSPGNVAEELVSVELKHVDGVPTEPGYEKRHFPGKRIFTRLIIASYSSLIAAVDHCGIVYVICTGDHFPVTSYSSENQIPHFWHSRLGMLVWWDIGSCDISYKRGYDLSALRSSKSLYTRSVDSPSLIGAGIGGPYNWHIRSFSTASQIIDQKSPGLNLESYAMRKIFLPKYKYSEGDLIFFSPLGLTRLVKREKGMGKKNLHIVHSHLHLGSLTHDEGCSNYEFDLFNGDENSFVVDAVGCAFHGCFYLVMRDGLSVVLPSLTVSDHHACASTMSRQPCASTGIEHQAGNILGRKVSKQPWSLWKVEILDRILLYESPQEADRLCLINGWDLKISRMRRLQLALDYLKYDEIEQSLEMLVNVHLAEEGILRLIFCAVYLAFCKASCDSDVSAALRLLALATTFSTNMIRRYGEVEHKRDAFAHQAIKGSQCSLPLVVLGKEQNKSEMSRKLKEIAHFLEAIRNLQCQVSAAFRRPGQGMVVDGGEAFSLVDADPVEDDPYALTLSADSVPSEKKDNHKLLSFPVTASGFNNPKMLDLIPLKLFDKDHLDAYNFGQVSDTMNGKFAVRKVLSLEHPKDMMARWESDNMDIGSIVKDALLSGRLPLAVLQLQLQRLKNFVADKEPYDTFVEVRDFGKAISYDLFLKGEIALAVSILQRLGEDIESSLKQLVFGTVRRSLRVQVAKEIKRYGYLGPYEWKMLDRISLIERLYPCSSFWRTYQFQHKESLRVSSCNAPVEIDFCIASSNLNIVVNCGEIDGVVLGSWTSLNENSSDPAVDDNDTHGFWAAAIVWSDVWDQNTIDRIMLDRPFLTGVHMLWESQLEYCLCHNDWEEVSKLLDMVPTSLLSYESLQIGLDGLQCASDVAGSGEFPEFSNYSAVGELDPVCMGIPNVKMFRFPLYNTSSMWLRTLVEQELAKKFIFLKEYWKGTAEIVPLLSHSGFVSGRHKIMSEHEPMGGSSPCNLHSCCPFQADTLRALDKLVVYHSTSYSLPNFLDLYLNYSKVIVDDDSLHSLLEAAGECQWAKWLLLTGIRGREYEASFSNWRSVISCNLGDKHSVLEIGDIIRTVDDIAEGGGEMAALATLMHAAAPIQNCLSSGSIKRHLSSSAQCTLENLRLTLQRSPALWRTLIAACFGQDTTYNFVGPKLRHVIGDSSLLEFLNWRLNIFFSTGHDTSLLQILPCWFPKSVRRLIQLYVQGPLGWQSLAGFPGEESFMDRDIDLLINANGVGICPISWEAAIQKQVEEELHDSSPEETGLGIEHHLHRGRPLAAFNHLLGVRAQKLKSDDGCQGHSGASAPGQVNIQLDVQRLLAPIVQSEESLLDSVTPLAILHFEDTVLSASCAFLLELCGLSASMLRVDIAALRRISSFYKSNEHSELHWQSSPEGSAFHAAFHDGSLTDFLAQALADNHLHNDSASMKESPNPTSNRRSMHALMLVLEHLEKASLPLIADRKTCGSWLSNGIDDGTKLRSQQKAESLYWNLVSVFCQMHHIPLSSKYLVVLARDNDWVGFLSEAQLGGYPSDTVIQVASKEFSDPRLRSHILTILKGMQSRKKALSLPHSDGIDKRSDASISDGNLYIPVQLFGILAECEKQKSPGAALLRKAKDLCWSILALVASCFVDVSPLSCLTVWLEITAARETSSIKVNDIAFQIANNVGAAIEVLNSLPVANSEVMFHYNRRSPKRRRLADTMSAYASANTISNLSAISTGGTIAVMDGNPFNEEIKKLAGEDSKTSSDSVVLDSLANMVAVLCEQHLFLPLLRAFEIFLPSCTLLPFIRSLQAFTQMRVSEASAHLGSFSARIKEEPTHLHASTGRDAQIGTLWISSTAVKAANAILSRCPSPYEKRCFLQLLAATDFGDGGSAATYYRRLYWKINLAEPLLSKDNDQHLGNETLDDASLLTALERNGHWEQARTWAKQMEVASAGSGKAVVHHVTETQAESMVAEWKEFLWDVPEERVALWAHCQTLFLRYSYPALQAGLFFLKHAESVEKDLPVRELHDLLMLSLQWLSGTMTQSHPVYPLHLLREIETRVWLLAVESEAQVKSERGIALASSSRDAINGHSLNIMERTASVIVKMDNHINAMRNRVFEKSDARENNQIRNKNMQVFDVSFTAGGPKSKRRAKGYLPSRGTVDTADRGTEQEEDGSSACVLRNDLEMQDENLNMEVSFSRWEERVGPAELERAVLSLLEFGQITAAKQLQNKLSPGSMPYELILVDVALKLAAISTPSSQVSMSMLDEQVQSVFQSHPILTNHHMVDPLKVLENLVGIFTEGRGRGLCKRIIAVVKAAHVLGLLFSEAFEKQPIEVLQLLSLKAQDSFEEAKLLVQTHSVPAATIAKILAESFLKGLLAAHRGGYMDCQKEEGPAPLLWRFSDFLKWAELCPSEPEIGHALMRLVITGQEIPHACEVELLILSHHFYKSSACLDGVDVLVALAATRVEAYVSEGDFSCLARLITGVGNLHALNFILGILIESGQLDLLLQKYSAAADTNTGTAEAVRGFRMAVLTSLKHFNPKDLDAFAMVYNHFDMKHETASLLESRAKESARQWFLHNDKDQNEELLDSMRYYIEAAEVHSSIDAGQKTRNACAQASLVSLQIRMPDFQWLNLSETNARRALVEQSRFQEALIVAEAYGLNQPSEWALVLWNQMLNPELTQEFVAEFVAVLPLQQSMLADLAKFYRSEVAARGDQSQFSVWLTGGGLPAEWAKYLWRSFRCLLKRTRDLRLRMQLANVATGFADVVDACMKALDKVPDNAGPLVLRRGHGGAYLPLM